MEKVYLYYESQNTKENESTLIYNKVFSTFNDAHKLMNQRRNELVENNNLIPHSIDGLGDKSWCRLYYNKDENLYIDLIIEEKNVNS